MPDIFTKAKRSAVMAAVRGSGNAATELRMMALLRAHGITGWRRQQRVFGKPDFVFRAARLAVFVDGCFWHGCPKPKHEPLPENNAAWWAAKLGRNRERDLLVAKTLRKAGWRVVRVWECDLAAKHWRRVARRVTRVLHPIRHPSPPASRRALGMGTPGKVSFPAPAAGGQ